MLAKLKRRLWRPFALWAYHREQNRLRRDVNPVIWITSNKLLRADLEYFEDRGRLYFSKEVVDDFAKSRDDVLSRVRKLNVFYFLVSLYLLGDLFRFEIEARLGGFSLKGTSGVREGLLLAVYAVSAYTALLQASVSRLDEIIKFGMTKAFPEELQEIYYVKYFPHEPRPLYPTFQTPHLLPRRGASFFIINGTKFILAVGIFTFIAFWTANIAVVIDTIHRAPFGYYSYAFGGFLLSLGLGILIFTNIAHGWLRYTDYSTLHEIELLGQINPEKAAKRSDDVYYRLREKHDDMVIKGYLDEPL